MTTQSFSPLRFNTQTQIDSLIGLTLDMQKDINKLQNRVDELEEQVKSFLPKPQERYWDTNITLD